MINNKKVIILIVAIFVAIVIGYLYYENTIDDLVYMPPTSVSPEVDIDESLEPTWLLSTTTEYSLRYPDDESSTYLSFVDWPPVVEITDTPFACTPAGEQTERAGRTDLVNVNGQNYCRTISSEGAAGSTYVQYAYLFPLEGDSAILTFSVRFPQCANYDDLQQDQCEQEQGRFNSDNLASGILSTFTLIE